MYFIWCVGIYCIYLYQEKETNLTLTTMTNSEKLQKALELLKEAQSLVADANIDFSNKSMFSNRNSQNISMVEMEAKYCED